MKCPRDGTTLVSEDQHGIEVRACPHCGGVWLEPGELQAIAESWAAITERIPPEEDAMTHAQKGAKEKQRPAAECPVCGDSTVREEYGLSSGIYVDRCSHGHGTWLDKGELEAIEEHYARAKAEADAPVLVQLLRQIGLKYD